ncbi:hypothetical protein VKT23_017689 [Stygiomarasmius scandens]|uniref:Uncharacterized protein n=1 Tax=Marasmiellus scandens TaxID=2682957 RepID=A0ABR1IUE6_9AGAR
MEKITVYLAINTRTEKTKWLNRVVDDWFRAWPYHTQDEPEEFKIITYLETRTLSVGNSNEGTSTSSNGASMSTSNVTQTTNTTSTNPDSDVSSSLTNDHPVGTQQKDLEKTFEEVLKVLSSEELDNLRTKRAELRASISANPSYRKTIRSWFGMKRLQINTASGAHNPFNNWFDQIRQLGNESTHAIPDFQWYLKHKTYGPKVKEAFDLKWKEMGKEEKYHLHYLCETAKEMLSQEPEEV